MGKEKLEFAGFSVELDSDNLKFNEATLNNYIQTEAGYYDNFGAFLSLAEKNLQNKEVQHEKLFSERFVEAKDAGDSDKKAEAKAKSDATVVKMKEDMVDARYVVNRLKQHLRAWDKNHDNAQSLGHMQRKMIDKLHADIMTRFKIAGDGDLEAALDETVKAYDSGDSKQPVESEFETNLDDML